MIMLYKMNDYLGYLLENVCYRIFQWQISCVSYEISDFFLLKRDNNCLMLNNEKYIDLKNIYPIFAMLIKGKYAGKAVQMNCFYLYIFFFIKYLNNLNALIQGIIRFVWFILHIIPDLL